MRPTGPATSAISLPTHARRNGSSTIIATSATGVNTPFRNSSDCRMMTSASSRPTAESRGNSVRCIAVGTMFRRVTRFCGTV
ncbi:hypothetical protein LMG24235_08756 [Paraburkholderia sabiae]|nr:hypothetical protein LMG24235_08756 [Paraburkholderia sabiae]